MILVIDNYDSFVHNLARYVVQLGHDTQVVRNDEISLNEIASLAPEAIILSPGPCTPNEAGVCLDVVAKFGPTIPILGICLGHQTIGQAFGGKVTKAKCPTHGKSRPIIHDGTGMYHGLHSPQMVARYHSLIVSHEDFPEDLEITSVSEEGEIMSLQHKFYPIYGLQYHPESVLTENGYDLIRNFLCCMERTQAMDVPLAKACAM